MKKKIIIISIVFIIMVGAISLFLFNNKIVTTITIDINPSIEINLDKNKNVVSVKALNEDAKEIIKDDFKGKSLDDTLKAITDNIINSDLIEERLSILVHSNDNNISSNVEKSLSINFNSKNIDAEIIIVKDITKEDEKLAKKYNITPAKAAYINSISKDNKNIKSKDLVNKPVSELKETKDTSNYCDSGYSLEGDRCLKEVRRESAVSGSVCPNGYYEYNNVCYEERAMEITSNLICPSEFTLVKEDCVRESRYSATPVGMKCNSGELAKRSELMIHSDGTEDEYTCIDTSSAKEPTLRCLTNGSHIIIDGKCYNGPAPTINGGCPNGDSLINGGCYSKDDEDQWICPNGGIYHKSRGGVPKYCPDTIKYTNVEVSSYKCENNDKLDGKECIRTEKIDPFHEGVCPSGYTKVDNDRCINYGKTTSMQDGLVCREENSRLKGKECIIYEIVEAKHNE